MHVRLIWRQDKTHDYIINFITKPEGVLLGCIKYLDLDEHRKNGRKRVPPYIVMVNGRVIGRVFNVQQAKDRIEAHYKCIDIDAEDSMGV